LNAGIEKHENGRTFLSKGMVSITFM
jgi:hypothetical protein